MFVQPLPQLSCPFYLKQHAKQKLVGFLLLFYLFSPSFYPHILNLVSVLAIFFRNTLNCATSFIGADAVLSRNIKSVLRRLSKRSCNSFLSLHAFRSCLNCLV